MLDVLSGVPTAYWAAIGALIGTLVLLLIEKAINRPGSSEDIPLELKQELREEVVRLREELKDAEKQLDWWKDTFYAVTEELSQVKQEIIQAEGSNGQSV